MSKTLFVCIFAAVAASALGLTCSNPQISSTSFTTQDATIVSQIAFISEFSLKCSNPEGTNLSLFAEVEGRLSPVVRLSSDRFQVSWTEDTKKASRGDYVVRLFDEEGFTAVRKAQRSGADGQSIAELASVVISHPGAFNGPWVNSVVFSTGLSVLVAYIAFSTKSKLLV